MERPIFSPNAGAAVLYIYREKMLKGSAMGNIAYLNDVTIAQLENGEYVRFETPPGVYDLWITNMPERSQGGRFHAYTKEINLSSGEIYYFKIVPVFGFYWSLDINPIDKMTAQKDILKLYDISNN
ncbi:MAG: DUF2846 domain-containing protein [Gammaproteobacteria bacterium]|nr:DUF2846 domain-containing protein [Gammaproteobacteria bacterium]